MTESIINGEMKVRVPDGFEIMDAETLKEAYMDDNPDRWGIRDRERHIVISVFYHRSSPALVKIAGNAGAVAKSTQSKLKKGLKDYAYSFGKYFDCTAGDLKASGFTYEYELKGIRQKAETVVAIKGNCCYTFYYYARKDGSPEDRRLFEDFLGSVSFI